MGVFLLQFIRSRVDRRTVDMSNVLRNHQISFVEQDLFLLENQLPFGVLKLIFEGAKFNGSPIKKQIKEFVTNFARPKATLEKNVKEVEEMDEEHSHLLNLLRTALLGGSERIRKLVEQRSYRSDSPSFRHIKELNAAGIDLKRSKTRFFVDKNGYNGERKHSHTLTFVQ